VIFQLGSALFIVFLVSVPAVRRAFDSDTPEYNRHYKVLMVEFIIMLIAYAACMSYAYSNYPYVFSAPGAVEDYRATSLFASGADTSGTTEIYGFKISIPEGFRLSRVNHVDQAKNYGAYDTVSFSSGSDQIVLTTKNGIMIEQLRPMMKVFDIFNSYDYYTDYINDHYGMVWMSVKAISLFEYSGFVADGWHGYIENGPLLSEGRYLAKNYNLWNDDPAVESRLEISFFFKNGGPSPALVSGILSSLRVSKAGQNFSDIKDAASKVNSGEFDSAMILLANALAENYRNANAHYYMARCFISRSRPDKKNFLKHIDEALRINPAHKAALELKSKTEI
jgi:hypothetical protein